MEQNTPMEAWPDTAAFEDEGPPSNPLMTRTARSVARTFMENVTNPLVEKAAMVPQAVAARAVGMMRWAGGAEPTPAVQPIEDKDPGRTDQYFRRGDSSMKLYHIRNKEYEDGMRDLKKKTHARDMMFANWGQGSDEIANAYLALRHDIDVTRARARGAERKANRGMDQAALMGFLADRSRSRVGPGTTLDPHLEKKILSYL